MAVHPLRPATDRRHGGPLPRHLANQTRDHLSAHKALVSRGCPPDTLCGISSRFQLLSPTERQVSHALLTRSPLTQGASSPRPFDLHVLGTPPAFVLSQDQTLKKWYLNNLYRLLKSFLNNLSSKFTQEFSLAVISFVHEFLKQSIIIVQGVL